MGQTIMNQNFLVQIRMPITCYTHFRDALSHLLKKIIHRKAAKKERNVLKKDT